MSISIARVDLIPFEKLGTFFGQHLAA